MVAYMIAMMNIHDPETYRKYTAQTPELAKRHGGRFLTRGGEITTLEGDPVKERMVILEFPSKAQVEAFHNDPDYVAAAKFRHQSSVARIFVQEGPSDSVNPPANV